MKIEQPYEDETFRLRSVMIRNLKDSENYFVDYLWHLGDKNISHAIWSKRVRSNAERPQVSCA